MNFLFTQMVYRLVNRCVIASRLHAIVCLTTFNHRLIRDCFVANLLPTLCIKIALKTAPDMAVFKTTVSKAM